MAVPGGHEQLPNSLHFSMQAMSFGEHLVLSSADRNFINIQMTACTLYESVLFRRTKTFSQILKTENRDLMMMMMMMINIQASKKIGVFRQFNINTR